MRSLSEGVYDQETVEAHCIQPWQLTLLGLNPDYPWWGPYEDCMADEGRWRSPFFYPDWAAFSLELNDLNEVVNFYFEAKRPSIECPSCLGRGLNKASATIEKAFYSFDAPHLAWNTRITDDETDALRSAGRLQGHKANLSAQGINRLEAEGMFHDAINRAILTQTRCKRLGVWGNCEACDGRGRQWTHSQAQVALVLWLLHPRKGASRAVAVKDVKRSDLPEVYAFLRQAADRLATKFSKLPKT